MSRPRTPSPSPPPPASRPYLQAVDRTCRRGIEKYELTSFYATPGALQALVDELVTHFRPVHFDAVVGLDALGLPLAGAVGYAAGVPVIVARKAGRLALPAEEVWSSARVGIEGRKVIEIRRDLLRPDMRVLVVDEWIDTGEQMTTATRLLEAAGVIVAGIGTLQLRRGRRALADALLRYDVFAANGFDEG